MLGLLQENEKKKSEMGKEQQKVFLKEKRIREREREERRGSILFLEVL